MDNQCGGGGGGHWNNIKQHHNNRSGTATTTEAETVSGQGKKKKARKIPGKYTHKKAGHCRFNGWGRAGFSQQFNALRKLVKDDRACPEDKQNGKGVDAFP